MYMFIDIPGHCLNLKRIVCFTVAYKTTVSGFSGLYVPYLRHPRKHYQWVIHLGSRFMLNRCAVFKEGYYQGSSIEKRFWLTLTVTVKFMQTYNALVMLTWCSTSNIVNFSCTWFNTPRWGACTTYLCLSQSITQVLCSCCHIWCYQC